MTAAAQPNQPVPRPFSMRGRSTRPRPGTPSNLLPVAASAAVRPPPRRPPPQGCTLTLTNRRGVFPRSWGAGPVMVTPPWWMQAAVVVGPPARCARRPWRRCAHAPSMAQWLRPRRPSPKIADDQDLNSV